MHTHLVHNPTPKEQGLTLSMLVEIKGDQSIHSNGEVVIDNQFLKHNKH